jgi:AsmA protein
MTMRRRSTEQDELMPGSAVRRQNLGTPPPRRRRQRRAPLIHPAKILRYLVCLCVLGLAAYAGLALLIDGERLRPNLEAAFSSATGRRVEMRKLSFSPRRLALAAEDLTVAEDPAFGGHVPFLQARRVDFRVRLAPLIFAHAVRVTAVSIDSPIVMLRQNAAGAWNFHSLLKASTRSVTDLDPPSIEIAGGRLSIAGFGDDTHSVRLRDLRLSSPALSLQMSNPLTLTANVEGGGWVKLEGRAGPTEWEPGGPLVPFSGLVHATNVNLSESNVVSSAPSVGGQLSLDASVESDGRMMRLDGQAKAVKLKLAAAGVPASEPLQAVFTLAHDLSTHAGVVNRCDSRVNKGTAGLTGKYVSAGQSPLLNLELAISDAPVTNLSPFLPALGFPLADSAGMVGGAATARIKLDGPLEGPFVTGSLAVDGARVTGFNLSQRLASVEGLDASGLENEFEIVSWKADLKSGGAGLNLENLETAIAGLGLLSGSGTIAPDSRLDFNMSGIRGLTGPKGRAIPFTIRGSCADPVFKPGR